jgi:hypothetical protein
MASGDPSGPRQLRVLNSERLGVEVATHLTDAVQKLLPRVRSRLMWAGA